MRVGDYCHFRTALSLGKRTGSLCIGGCAPGSVYTVAEYLVHAGIRSPNRPPRSESLYRLSYPGPLSKHVVEFCLFIVYKYTQIHFAIETLYNEYRL
jgi:hypothetical protein